MRRHKDPTKCPKQKTTQADNSSPEDSPSPEDPHNPDNRHKHGGAAPVTWQRTSYVALHPNRRGVMPTVRVRCLLEQVKVWSVRAEVTASHSGEDCLVAVACGLVDMIDLAKAQLTLVTVAYGLVCRGQAAGDAPVTWRCTRYVAVHLLCGAAPEQKGCNAYGSGALPLRTSESVVSCC